MSKWSAASSTHTVNPDFSKLMSRIGILCCAVLAVSGCDALSDLFSGTDEEDEVPAVLIESLEGVDLSLLERDRERGRWSSLVTDLGSPCGDPITIVECIENEDECAGCVPAAQYLVRQVALGRSSVDIEDDYRHRYFSDPVDISLSGPSKGPEDAPVTIVEFSDFECPYCGLMTPLLAQTYEHFEGQIRIVFKQYPLAGHERARPAARASIAAMRQGKFWEMHDLLFANQDALEASDLTGYARELGLDVEQFEADMADPETEALIDLNRQEGQAVDVRGTPTLFVNGVLFRDDPELFPVYIAETLAALEQ